MKRSTTHRARLAASVLALLALAALPTGLAAAPGEEADELATLSAGEAELSWTLTAPAGQAILSIGGDEVELRRELTAGKAATLSLFDAAGQPLPDGTYSWELTTMPAPIKGSWSDPANGRDGAKPVSERPIPAPARTQTGWFTVTAGRLVDSGAIEFEGRKDLGAKDLNTAQPHGEDR